MKIQHMHAPQVTVVDGIEIPPISLGHLTDYRPVKKWLKKVLKVLTFVGNHWVIFMFLGLAFLFLVFGPLVDYVFAK